jgi:hypothetical protein
MKSLIEFDAYFGSTRGTAKINPDNVLSLFSEATDREHTWIYLTDGTRCKVTMPIDLVESKLARGNGV